MHVSIGRFAGFVHFVVFVVQTLTAYVVFVIGKRRTSACHFCIHGVY